MYNIIYGTPQSENFFGTEANDIILATVGSDYADGRGGLDVVVVSGSSADYSFGGGNDTLGMMGTGSGSYLRLVRNSDYVQIKVSNTWYNFGATIPANDLLTEYIAFADEPGKVISVASTWESWGSGNSGSSFGLVDAQDIPLELQDSLSNIVSPYGNETIESPNELGSLPGNLSTVGFSQDGASIYLYDGSNKTLTKYSTDGSVIQAFGNNGEVSLPSPYNQLYGLTELQDGSIILGLSEHKGGNFDNGVAKLSPSGILDSSFGNHGVIALPNTAPTLNLSGSYVDRNGYIYALGTNNWGGSLVIYRIDQGGSVDSSFGSNGLFELPINNPGRLVDFLTLSNNKSVILASDPYNGYKLIGLTEEGEVDVSFGVDGVAILSRSLYTTPPPDMFFSPISIGENSNGQILVSGSYTNTAISSPSQTTGGEFRLYSSLGSLISDFGTSGSLFIDTRENGFGARSLLFSLNDGRYLKVGGDSSNVQFALYDANGAVVSDYGSDGYLYYSNESGAAPSASSIKLLDDGSWIFLSPYSSYSNSTWTTTIRVFQTRPIMEGLSFSLPTAPPSSANQVICFLAHTRVRTALGDKEIERLLPSDKLTDHSGKEHVVRRIGKQVIHRRFAKINNQLPIKIPKNYCFEGYPEEDLYLSPHHALLIAGHLIEARALNGINGATYSSAVPSTLEYYHIELDTHELICANGMWCETYVNHVPRKEFTSLWSEDGFQLEERNIVEMTIPRIQYRRQIPNEILKFLENKVASHT